MLAEAEWRPDLWFTYHLYYKAPDFIGPIVSDALQIPYAVAEASYSARRTGSDWGPWLEQARLGVEQADAIFCFTERDKTGLLQVAEPRQLIDLPPFIDIETIGRTSARRLTDNAGPVRLVTVAMMRPGAKLESYRFLGQALRHLRSTDWHLDVVGDGSARTDVEQAFDGIAGHCITWHGQADGNAIGEMLQNGDIFVWPGFEEAFGMVYLEAQANGLPVIALETAGVPAVVAHGISGLLCKEASPEYYATLIRRLIDDAGLRTSLGQSAVANVRTHHSIGSAARTMGEKLRALR